MQTFKRYYFCSKGLAARQIENLLFEERDAIALLHFHCPLNTPLAGKTEFCKNRRPQTV
jgi:hypothetical protein